MKTIAWAIALAATFILAALLTAAPQPGRGAAWPCAVAAVVAYVFLAVTDYREHR